MIDDPPQGEDGCCLRNTFIRGTGGNTLCVCLSVRVSVYLIICLPACLPACLSDAHSYITSTLLSTVEQIALSRTPSSSSDQIATHVLLFLYLSLHKLRPSQSIASSLSHSHLDSTSIWRLLHEMLHPRTSLSPLLSPLTVLSKPHPLLSRPLFSSSCPSLLSTSFLLSPFLQLNTPLSPSTAS